MKAKFVFEYNKEGILFRSTDENFLRILLDQDQIIIRPEGKFISLSRDSDSGGMDNFGGKELVIQFDEIKIFNQGAIEIEYDVYFFNEYPDICLYVTGYKGEEDYYQQLGYKNAEEANENYELSWEQNIEDYSHEEEIVLKKIKYESDLIRFVDILIPAHPILISMLEDNNIPYKLHKGIKRLEKKLIFGNRCLSVNGLNPFLNFEYIK